MSIANQSSMVVVCNFHVLIVSANMATYWRLAIAMHAKILGIPFDCLVSVTLTPVIRKQGHINSNVYHYSYKCIHMKGVEFAACEQ